MKQLIKISGLAFAALVLAGLLYPATGDAQQKDKGDKGKQKKEKVYEVGADGLKIETKLAETDAKDKVRIEAYCKVYLVKMAKGTKYEVRMNAADTKELDPLLRIEDAKGKEFAFNDDAPGENTLNSRIDFTPEEDGVYRIITTSFNKEAKGDFTLLIKTIK
jgi:hypothetical protein